MKKKIWLMGLLFALGILVGLGATSVFAQEGQDSTPSQNTTWEEMHEACTDGNYEAMEQWHEQCYGAGDGTGGMMGGHYGGMMGGNYGGMMGGNSRGMMGGGMMGGWYR